MWVRTSSNPYTNEKDTHHTAENCSSGPGSRDYRSYYIWADYPDALALVGRLVLHSSLYRALLYMDSGS